MEEIRLISTTTVGSKDPNQSLHRVGLTPWDLNFLLLGPIQKGLLFPKPTTPTSTIHHLQNSLSRTLDFFPPLAGRLASTKHDDDTTTFFIDCNNSGALFVHAVADNIAIHDILELVYVPRILHSFFPLNGVLNHQGVSQPVLGIQVTELADGLFIGCTMNHTVADGSSFWNFFNTWSEIARSPDGIISRPPPLLNRWFPDDNIHHPIRIPSFEAQLESSASNIPPQVQLRERVFHFTRERISGLKTKANSEMGTTRISSLQALLCHIWRAVVRCRGADANQETMFKLGIGARSRLKPPLPGDYFGNAVQIKTITSTSGEVVERGLGRCAWEMNKFIDLQTDDEIRKYLESWVESPKLQKMGDIGHISNVLVTSSSPRFNVYGNDFGWGKPVAVRSGAGNKFDGKLTVFCGMEEGSIDVEVSLTQQTLEAMVADAEFMESVD